MQMIEMGFQTTCFELRHTVFAVRLKGAREFIRNITIHREAVGIFKIL